ncbi:NEDD8 activating enzyme [Syncephalis fuscata]|nr:NEDD8 activating enzyme [Syncephalis fuscata]
MANDSHPVDITMTEGDWRGRWDHLWPILYRPGPMAHEGFTPGNDTRQFLMEQCKVLVVGAGGLGCEILKNLALSGFRDIHVIDMDTIDVSNLNRQFLFRSTDVGQSKAETAAAFIMRRIPHCKVTPYCGKIQDKDQEYYAQFNVVICGLDSVEARRWMNATLVQMFDSDEPESLKPLVDGGTEGFRGQARVILPTISSCYECSLDMLTPQTVYPVCTIANTPRLPEHCIEWASALEWPRLFPDETLDMDNPEHVKWVFNTASDRARQFNITGVTIPLTQGVVKNIIPAIASTNAIIAAACCNEVFKLATSSASLLDNYMMYTGTDGVYTHTFEHEKKSTCLVCGQARIKLDVHPLWTLEEWIDHLIENPNIRVKKPSLRTPTRSLYMQAPRPLEEATRPNLSRVLGELLQEGDVITVTDVTLPISMEITIHFQEPVTDSTTE